MKTLLLDANMNNIIFSGRNKSYGAYLIRATYNNTVVKSLFITACVFLALFLIAYTYSNHEEVLKKADTGTNIPSDTIVYNATPPVEKPKSAAAAVTKATLTPHATDAVSTNLVDSAKIKDDQNTNLQANNSLAPGNAPAPGTDVDLPAPGSGFDGPNRTVVEPASNSPVSYADLMPQRPGDYYDVLKRNLHYPEAAKEANISGQVVVNFIIDEKGEVESLKIISGIGYGCDEEAIRVLKIMSKWKPGMMNGRPVKVTFNQTIGFKLH